MFTHLHTRSVFSFLQAGSTPEDLVRRARSLDFNALALTDVNGVYGAVRFLKACRQQEIKGLIGAEVMVDANPLVLIARNTDGYTDLCRILTRTHMMDRKFPFATLDTLASHSADLFCLTGGRDGLLRQFIAARRQPEAERWIETLKDIFQNRLFVELTHHLVYGDNHIIPALHHFARQNHVNVVATNDVRYAESKDYRRYDLLTCVRLGITVMDPHPARPVNAEASLKSETDLRKLIKYPEAFENSALITENCALDLVPELITPPDARIPDNTPPLAYLDTLCKDALIRKYPETRRDNAVKQYRREIDVIAGLGLEEYFLVVREVVHEAWRRGIRCAGRGSAANSIVAYLLDITGVDPLAHNLLFERFLHGGRKGTPDIDIDFDSERRDEIIEWMEHRFGIEQTAMTATVVTYQLRLALRDTAKTLGWPQDIINRLTPAIPSRRASAVREYRHNLVPILGESPLFELLLDLVESLENCPRHLGLHVGGMILSRKPLPHFSPVQISANGVKMVQFDKNDVEALGLVKLDVLGLRMLATLSEAVEIATRADDPPTDIDHIPLDDEKVYHMICHDSTIGLFQIESQGQIHLLAVNQPRTFDDLVAEIALFRPGPLQGGMVHPYIRRRKGQEKVTFDHPDLAPILADTYGIILFQEQVLEVAHRFAGMSLAEADDFRALMSKYRDPSEMESMRTRFVTGAIHRGVPEQTANLVFDRVSKFVGYGFCRSHAAAFAKIVYQSAWMKCYHPAPYMAAFMQHRPGMYSLMTLEQETKRLGVHIALPDVRNSRLRYDVVKTPDHAWTIVKPLTSIDHVTPEIARNIVWARADKPFTSTEDFFLRVHASIDALENIARSGALDTIAGSSRKALWELGVLHRKHITPGTPLTPTLFDLPRVQQDDIPDLPPLSTSERLTWDYQTHHAGRAHPIGLIRRTLNDFDILPIAACRRLVPLDDRKSSTVVTVTGNVIMRQRPPTANGMMFITLEDETGFIQCVLNPSVQEKYDHHLTLPAMTIRGVLQAVAHWRGLVAVHLWGLKGMLGGYAGFPGQHGGMDRLQQGEYPDKSDDLPPELPAIAV